MNPLGVWILWFGNPLAGFCLKENVNLEFGRETRLICFFLTELFFPEILSKEIEDILWSCKKVVKRIARNNGFIF